MSWSQSVDQALCFGWINKESYCIRFTPRKPTSIWSVININKVETLNKLGLMTPAGQKAFDLRTANRSGIYAHEKEAVDLAPDHKRQFKMKLAWDFFNEQAASYKKLMIHWIMSAKQELEH